MRTDADRSVERQAVRMHQMMRRLDADPAALIRLRRGEAYAEARARCLCCTTIGDCLRWLDGYALEGESPDFCPNLQLFLALQAEAPRLQMPERPVQSGMAAGFPEPALPDCQRER